MYKSLLKQNGYKLLVPSALTKAYMNNLPYQRWFKIVDGTEIIIRIWDCDSDVNCSFQLEVLDRKLDISFEIKDIEEAEIVLAKLKEKLSDG